MKVIISLIIVLFSINCLNANTNFSATEKEIISEIDFLFTRLSANSDSTYNAIKNIEEKCNNIGFKLGIAHCYRFYGKHQQFTGEFPNALKSFQFASSQIKKVGSNKDIGLIKRDLGEYYRAVNNSEVAIRYLKDSEKIFFDLNDSINLARTYNRLSAAYFESGERNIALDYARKSQSLIKLDQNKDLQSNNYTLIGIMQKDNDSLEYYYLLAKDLAEEVNSKIELITIYANISLHYHNIGNFAKAEEYGLKSFDISMKNTFKSGIARSAKILSMVYTAVENYQKALEYLEIAYNYRDTISSEKKIQEINDIKTKRELELQEIKFTEQKKDYIFAILGFIFIVVLGSIFIFLILAKNRKLKESAIELKDKNELITIQNKDLVNLNATKDKFFSIIAHDLRNPVNAFGMASEYIKHELDNLDTEHLKELLDELSKNSTQLSSLLENLLTWSRAQRKAIQLNKISFQLTYLVDTIFGVMSASASNKGIKLTSNVTKDFNVFGDTNVINTIIRNLVSNAIKYSNKGDTITISAEKIVLNSVNYSKISISDTGIGMDDSTLLSLFKIETNTSNPGTIGESGTGLGLILCKEFAELHNGCIKAESELGNGSTFFVLLPEQD